MAEPMHAGRLKQRVAFDRRADDDNGAPLGHWAPQFERRAEIRALKGTEEVMAQRLEGRQPVLVTIRYSADALRIVTGWRVRDARTGATYNITGAAPTTDLKWIEILAVSGGANG